MKIAVDLRAKFVDPDVSVYLARAGKGGHLFASVSEHRAIGPDLPGLNINLEKGASDPTLAAKVKRARSLRAWLRQPEKSRGSAPSRNLAEYEMAAATAGHAQIEGLVSRYFGELKPGDLVVIPNPSMYGNAIVAEIGTGIVRYPGAGRYEGYEFDGRPIKGGVNVPMAKLPRSIIDLTQRPTGLARIASPIVRREIIDLAYRDYMVGDQYVSRIRTTKTDFTSFDSNVLNSLISMVLENERRSGSRDPVEFVNLIDAAFIPIDPDVGTVRIDINSPGRISLLSSTLAPFVAGTLLAVFIATGFDAAALAAVDSIEVVGSGEGDLESLCKKDIGKKTLSMLNFLAMEAKFNKQCSLLKKTHQETGAAPTARARIETDG